MSATLLEESFRRRLRAVSALRVVDVGQKVPVLYHGVKCTDPSPIRNNAHIRLSGFINRKRIIDKRPPGMRFYSKRRQFIRNSPDCRSNTCHPPRFAVYTSRIKLKFSKIFHALHSSYLPLDCPCKSNSHLFNMQRSIPNQPFNYLAFTLQFRKVNWAQMVAIYTVDHADWYR